jgi:hypothetical protein
MADPNTPSDPNMPSDPAHQEQTVERRPHHQDPTRVETTRTSDASTITAGGLAGGRPAGGPTITPERARYEERTGVDPAVRSGHDDDRSDRAKQGSDDPVLPAEDATLNTKI